jgi:UDP-2-acetamido-2,6-beta-L-arabino-hexul-4-ose reductase
MIKVGITGQQGFVGQYLYNTLRLFPQEFERVTFRRDFFEDESKLVEFVSSCDVIVHLAAMNRHTEPEVIYITNIDLVQKLVRALGISDKKPHILFSSSSQEERDNYYGRSKKEGRETLLDWSERTGALFTGLVIPNVFGPFCNPFYNSVIATFCYQLTHNGEPKIDVDGQLKLLYIDELVKIIIQEIRAAKGNQNFHIPHSSEYKVSEILKLLVSFKEQYFIKGEIPNLRDKFELNLFNTFRSYIEIGKTFPVKLHQHKDNRGVFAEIIRVGDAGCGQTSYSTTLPNVTRGDHFHTRKIERFTVIKGKALIQLRKIGTEEIFNYYLDGNSPGYVDMPVWHTHNIKNIGDEELLTIFWINEFYDPSDPDTYMEPV